MFTAISMHQSGGLREHASKLTVMSNRYHIQSRPLDDIPRKKCMHPILACIVRLCGGCQGPVDAVLDRQ